MRLSLARAVLTVAALHGLCGTAGVYQTDNLAYDEGRTHSSGLMEGVVCPPGYFTGSEGECEQCFVEGTNCTESSQCCYNMSCDLLESSGNETRCQCSKGADDEMCSSLTGPSQGPVPTSMIIAVTAAGSFGLVCISIYTYKMTSVKRQSPAQVVPPVTANPKQHDTLKVKAKHVVEHLLRGASLVAFERSLDQRPRLQHQQSTISTSSVHTESDI